MCLEFPFLKKKKKLIEKQRKQRKKQPHFVLFSFKIAQYFTKLCAFPGIRMEKETLHKAFASTRKKERKKKVQTKVTNRIIFISQFYNVVILYPYYACIVLEVDE